MRLVFAKDMTTWRIPETGAVTRITPLVSGGTGYWDLLLGNHASYIGTGCAAALVLGMIFLCFSGIISPAAPIAYLGSAALLSWIGGYDVLSQLLSSVMDGDMRTTLEKAPEMLKEAEGQLKGPEHSIMVLSTSLPAES